MPDKQQSGNPVVRHYRGVPIKKYPIIFIRISSYEMERLIDQRLDFGMTEKEAILSGKVIKANHEKGH